MLLFRESKSPWPNTYMPWRARVSATFVLFNDWEENINEIDQICKTGLPSKIRWLPSFLDRDCEQGLVIRCLLLRLEGAVSQ
jgi:hypothetical protein